MTNSLHKLSNLLLSICFIFYGIGFDIAFSNAATNTTTTDLEAVTAIFEPTDPVVGESVGILFLVLNNGQEALVDSAGFNYVGTYADFVVEDSEPILPLPSSDEPVKPGDLYYFMVTGYFTSPGEKTITFTVDNNNELSEFNETNNTTSRTVSVAETSPEFENIVIHSTIVSDIKQIQTALELYFNDNSKYPAAFASGNKLGIDALCLGQAGFSTDCSTMSTTYMGLIPYHPLTPQTDYVYHSCGKDDYIIEFFLVNDYNVLPAGLNYATPFGIVNELRQEDFYSMFDIDKCLNDEIIQSASSAAYDIKAGWLVKNNAFAEVFYVDSNKELRWVINEEVAVRYFGANWATQVKEYENLKESGLKYGNSITEDNFSLTTDQNTQYSYSDIKTGWLVKNKKFAEVFYVVYIDGDQQLRWIPDEYTAEKYFGANWAQEIIEFDDLAASGLKFGEPLGSAIEL